MMKTKIKRHATSTHCFSPYIPCRPLYDIYRSGISAPVKTNSHHVRRNITNSYIRKEGRWFAPGLLNVKTNLHFQFPCHPRNDLICTNLYQLFSFLPKFDVYGSLGRRCSYNLSVGETPSNYY